mgnify:FL=1|jgi:hypothetical protein|tara:strand:- start:82 stop:606 length:525 start_codon:yes stop_codon:yes gene_type:complete
MSGDDNWDVDDSDSDTDVTLNPSKMNRTAIIKIYKIKPHPAAQPAEESTDDGPTFLCTIDKELPANIVRVDSTPLEETYTLSDEGGLLSLQIFAFDTLQCRWELTEATESVIVEAWKPEKTPEKKILRAWWYEWVDERGQILNQYKNAYSGTTVRGWPESHYGRNIFGHECKTI